MTEQQITDLLEKHASELGEHFDAVQILATWHEGGLTYSRAYGSGNWYARQGMASAFINRDIADEQAKMIGKAIQPPDDGDAWKQAE